MTNDMISNKRVLMAAMMLLAVTFVASAPLLVPTTRAFAQEDGLPNVDEILQGANISSENEEEGSSSEGETDATTAGEEEQQGSSDSDTASLEDSPNSEINIDAQEEAEISTVEEDDFVNVDPIIQTAVQTDVNVNADTALVMDEEDCDEATDESIQANGQGSSQIAGSAGEVGDGSTYVSPKIQVSEQVALNVNGDTDVILAEGCSPEEDTVGQVNIQESTQGVGNDLEASSEGSTTIIPVYQTQDSIQHSIGANRDIHVGLPVL